MDGIFGALIWLVIIFFWIFSFSKKTKRLVFFEKDSESREKEAPSELEKKLLEALGISFPEIPEPAIQKSPEPKIEEKIHTPRPGNRALQGADEIWPLGHSAQGTPGFSPGGLHYVEKKKEPKASREVPKPAVAAVIVEETEREFPDSSTVEKLQEGVVFSVILGPPKAYRFLGLYSKKPSQ